MHDWSFDRPRVMRLHDCKNGFRLVTDRRNKPFKCSSHARKVMLKKLRLGMIENEYV